MTGSSAAIRAQVAHVRGGAVGLCLSGAPADGFGARGIIEVTGGDATRWLDGMISNDAKTLAAGTRRSGCYATVLTQKGRIVADVHVLARAGGYWLETSRSAVPGLIASLERYIIADDVRLVDRTRDIARLGLEGAAACPLLARAATTALQTSPREALDALAPDAWIALEIGGVSVAVCRFGWSGEDAFQLFVPAANEPQVIDALHAADSDGRLAACSTDALDVLRIEAGVPLLGAELHGEIFPDEARLDRAISRSKGCYTGQEIVARLYSRGAVNHLLVGLRFDAAVPPAVDTSLVAEGRRAGEITSVCTSPSAGAIGLGYLRRDSAAAGTVLDAAGIRAEVAELPLVRPATPPPPRADERVP